MVVHDPQTKQTEAPRSGNYFLTCELRLLNLCFVIATQVGVTYNVDKAPPESSFDFLLDVIRETDYEIDVKACSMWTENDQKSGMAVMDVGIPSGFELNWDGVEKVKAFVKFEMR